MKRNAGIWIAVLLYGWCAAGPGNGIAEARCVDWILVQVEDRVWTWQYYLYWYGLSFARWSPNHAWQEMRRRSAAWQQFIRDLVTIWFLYDNGFARPRDIRVAELYTSLRNQYTWLRSLDPVLARRVLRDKWWIRIYRDRTFRHLVVIQPDEVAARYWQQYPDESHRPPLETVYEELYETLLQERLRRAFREWQDGLRERYRVTVLPIPPACEQQYAQQPSGKNTRR